MAEQSPLEFGTGSRAGVWRRLRHGRRWSRLNYQITYKTNYSDYRVLASGLLSTNNYAFDLAAVPLMQGEREGLSLLVVWMELAHQ